MVLECFLFPSGLTTQFEIIMNAQLFRRNVQPMYDFDWNVDRLVLGDLYIY